MENCSVIMPITTPGLLVPVYAGDNDHFAHVLAHLFVPAIEKAGLSPVLPVTEGSEVIHGDIIKHLEVAEIVLCDISSLNPNVFFELSRSAK